MSVKSTSDQSAQVQGSGAPFAGMLNGGSNAKKMANIYYSLHKMDKPQTDQSQRGAAAASSMFLKILPLIRKESLMRS